MSYYTGHKNNKYPQIPEAVFDFHGLTTSECKYELEDILKDNEYAHIRIIVGRGTRSQNGAVLPNFVCNFLNSHNIRYSPSKPQDGGDGAIEVYF